jgi:hypothetical protein
MLTANKKFILNYYLALMQSTVYIFCYCECFSDADDSRAAETTEICMKVWNLGHLLAQHLCKILLMFFGSGRILKLYLNWMLKIEILSPNSLQMYKRDIIYGTLYTQDDVVALDMYSMSVCLEQSSDSSSP